MRMQHRTRHSQRVPHLPWLVRGYPPSLRQVLRYLQQPEQLLPRFRP